jgi:ATP-dependent DNA helicase RecQ
MKAVRFKDPIQRALEVMGYQRFLSPQQEQLVRLIAGGNDALGILPTGAGKTACFVLPAIANNWTVAVVSPLVALMNDQIANLRRHGLSAFAITATTTREEILEAKIQLTRAHQPVFIFS